MLPPCLPVRHHANTCFPCSSYIHCEASLAPLQQLLCFLSRLSERELILPSRVSFYESRTVEKKQPSIGNPLLQVNQTEANLPVKVRFFKPGRRKRVIYLVVSVPRP